MTAADNDPTKDQSVAKPTVPPEEQGLVSLDDLDRIIADQDPEFKQGIDEIGSQKAAEDLNLELIDLDQLLKEQAENSLRSKIRRLGVKFRNFTTGLKTTLFYFLKNDVPAGAKKGLGALKKGIATLQEGLRQFGFKPRKFKLLVFSFIGICILAIAILYFLLTKNLIHAKDRLFIQNMADLAEETEHFDPKTEQEPFYDSVRSAQNIISLPKLVVNIKRSATSGPNPMAAVEIYIEGNFPDVIVEIKDRETEFKDAFMRTIEEFSYDELDTVEGKHRLLERFAREANKLATKGRIRKTLFKTIIIKP